MFHDVKTIGQRSGKSEILFHHDDGEALDFEGLDHECQCLHDDGREAFRDFIQQQAFGAGAQNSAHCQHLLLAPRKACARAAASLVQIGEHGVDFVD